MKTFTSLVVGCLFGAALIVTAAVAHDRLTPKTPPIDPGPDMLAKFRVAIVQCEATCGSAMPFDFIVGADSIRCLCPRPGMIRVAKVP